MQRLPLPVSQHTVLTTSREANSSSARQHVSFRCGLPEFLYSGMMRNVGWSSADVSGLLTILWCVKSQKTEEFSSSAPQEIPPILWNLKVHQRVQNSPPRILMQRQIKQLELSGSFM
jgi:hypothetical protein